MGHGSSPKMIFFRSHKMSSPSGFEEMNCKFHSVSEYIRIICLINVIKHIHFVDDILVYWYHHLNLWSHISYYHQSSILRNKKMPPPKVTPHDCDPGIERATVFWTNHHLCHPNHPNVLRCWGGHFREIPSSPQFCQKSAFISFYQHLSHHFWSPNHHGCLPQPAFGASFDLGEAHG